MTRDDAVYAPHNYPFAGTNHGYATCGIHGSDTGAGAFASRWGLLISDSSPPNRLAASQMKLNNFIDGTSNTIIISEFAQGLPYITPASHTNNMGRSWFDPFSYGNTLFTTMPLATPNNTRMTYSTTHNWGTVGSYHEGGVHCALMDGSVKFVSENIDGTVWWGACTPMGREVLGDF